MAASERKHLRVRGDRAIAIRHAGAALRETASWAGSCRDISVTGLGFVCGPRFPVGAILEIDLPIDACAFSVKAEVVRVEEGEQGCFHGARWLARDGGTAAMLEELSQA